MIRTNFPKYMVRAYNNVVFKLGYIDYDNSRYFYYINTSNDQGELSKRWKMRCLTWSTPHVFLPSDIVDRLAILTLISDILWVNEAGYFDVPKYGSPDPVSKEISEMFNSLILLNREQTGNVMYGGHVFKELYY